MRKNFACFASALLLFAGPPGTASAGENFTVKISGTPEETSVSILSRGDKTNLEGFFSVLREEGALKGRLSSLEEGAALKYGGAEAGGALSGEITEAEDGSSRGFLRGEGLFFNIPGEGFSLRDGTLRANVENGIVGVESLEFNGRGVFRADGSIGFDQNGLAARLNAEIGNFPVFERPDRHLRLSGTVEAETSGGETAASGNFRIEKAFFYIAGFDVSSPPPMDITVVGEPPPPDFSHPLEEAFITIDLGENFRIKSRELDVKLEGTLEIRLRGGEPVSLKGSVRSVEGSYRAYGQEMYIERGAVTFTGPPDNPDLDILALHKHRNIDVGIRISGPLAAPAIELYSYPDMPDVEKLSHLVLGRSFETAGRGDASLIATAAAAILAPEEYARLESEILKTTGLDEIRLAPENDRHETVVVLGKQISSRLYLTYRKGLAGLTNAAILEYFMSRRWIVRAETGRDNLIGVTYSIAFD